ncbi:MAG TPA: hopanoid biosynthesis-associated protein HpnK [Steroidobacteraceae bacterium]|nr:hopanoid biosynthesis-associated protein HpnK [Steroidobacteraceae bacterium]
MQDPAGRHERLLIVTADDFGLHPAVNEAVEAACAAGTLTAASLMVGAPHVADAVRRARTLPALAVGLHLTLADGQAVLPRRRIPDLVDAQGRFGDHMAYDGWRFFAYPGVKRQLAAEIRAQFQAFADTGLVLDHADAHKHFHLHPGILAMLIAIGREFGLRSVRIPAEPRTHARRTHPGAGAALGSALLSPWLAHMRRRVRAAGLACNDRVFGIADSGGLDEQRLLAILEALPPGLSEIYLHPATRSGAAISASMSGYRHEAELAALLSPRVQARLSRGDIVLSSYGRAVAPGCASGAA